MLSQLWEYNKTPYSLPENSDLKLQRKEIKL
jgi:hypothetical protein